MRKITTVILLFLSFSGLSQQIAQYSQWSFNQFAINPALAGVKRCLDVRTAVRAQWAGFEGAPQSGLFTINAPLNKKKKRYNDSFHGLGGKIERDVFGSFNNFSLSMAYARSEEHTSELQSRPHLVCRLLLEKSDANRDLLSFPTRRSSDLTAVRAQWAGFEGAPQSGLFTINAPLNKKKKRYNDSFHGLGGKIERDVFGSFNNFSLSMAYAIHFPIGRSEERRVGKECRSRWQRSHRKEQ